MSDEQQEYSGLPEYQAPAPPSQQGQRIATAKEQKPIMKMINKMLKPKMNRVMKQQLRVPKKKHTVHFY